MTAADRPSVTDDARVEAERRYPDRTVYRTSLGADPEREGKRHAFIAGVLWAAGRAETTTATSEDAVERVFQTTHPAPNTVMGWIRAGYEAGLLALAPAPTVKETDP